MTGRSRVLTRIQSIAVALVAIGVATVSLARSQDLTRPPRIVNSAGPFYATLLSQPPVIDGREWIPADVHPTSSPGTVPGPTRAFTLTLRDCGDHRGDFERCELLLQRGRAAPVRIHDGYTGWVFVTPNSRYIITEPLYVLDVREWKQYALFDALNISNYTSIEAISRDGTRLFISRRDCAMDCKDVQVEYFELTLPRADGDA